MKSNVMNVINALSDLKVKINEDENSVQFSGLRDANETTNEVTIDIHLSVAPSVQSMLSRQGHIGCTVHIKVNNDTAFYATSMDKEEMGEVGGFLCKLKDKIREGKGKKAYDAIADLM